MYTFANGGISNAFWTNKFLDGKFSNPVNPRDGFALIDCEDIRACRILEFLVSISYLEKPTQVTITLANTIFEALSRDCPVNSSGVIEDIILNLIFGVGKPKPPPIVSISSTYIIP